MTATGPKDKDIIVDIFAQRDGSEQACVYVRNAPGSDEYSFGRRDEALAYALAWARRQCVQAWLTENWYDFTLLGAFRRED